MASIQRLHVVGLLGYLCCAISDNVQTNMIFSKCVRFSPGSNIYGRPM